MTSQQSFPPLLLALIGKQTDGQNIFIYPGDQIVIGRHPTADLTVQDDEVSGKHCRLTYGQTGLIVEDLGSSNGTYVGGRLLTKRSEINPDQGIQVGLSILKFFPPDPEFPVLDGTRLYRVLGVGVQGRVYEAQLPNMAVRAALKVMHSDMTVKDRIRCQREAQIQASLDHTAIARCHGLHDVDGVLFLISEYIDGQNLLSHLAEQGPLPWKLAVELGLTATQALAYAHGRGVLHRDIKPGNLIIEKNSHKLKIIDFGIAKRESQDDTSVDLTSQGVMIGTYAYMAKEAFLDGQNLTAAADIFSLGATLYELMTGHEPFRARTLREHLEMREQPIPPLGDVCPAPMNELLQMALNPRPEDRYPNMETFGKALQSILMQAP
jgi:serine/threonine protein kinase